MSDADVYFHCGEATTKETSMTTLYTVAVADRLADQLRVVGVPSVDAAALAVVAGNHRKAFYEWAYVVPVADLPITARTAQRRAATHPDGIAEGVRPGTMSETLPRVRVDRARIDRYMAAARAAEMSMSQWVRGALDGAAGGE